VVVAATGVRPLGHHRRPHVLAAAAPGRCRALCSTSTTPRTAAAEVEHRELYANAWYPLAFDALTDRLRPVSLSLLGAPLALWWAGGEWSAVLDRCPHRLAPLSEGRIDEHGLLECPYHGWAFNQAGACVRIPQLEIDDTQAQAALRRACATSLDVCVVDGIIWAWAAPLLGSAVPADPLQLERYRLANVVDPGTVVLDYFRELPMDASTLLENVLDPAHLNFAHHGTISRRGAALPVRLRLLGEVGRDGFELERGQRGAAKRQAASAPAVAEAALSPPLPSTGSVRFVAPHFVLSRTDRAGSYSDWNVVYAVPTRPGSSRLFVRIVFDAAKMSGGMGLALRALGALPAPLSHVINHAVLEDDNILLHLQERSLASTSAAGSLGEFGKESGIESESESESESGSESRSESGTARGARQLPPGLPPDPQRSQLAPNWRRRLLLPTSADAGVVSLRRWLDAYTGGYGVYWAEWGGATAAARSPPAAGPGAPLPAVERSRRALVERLESHTEHCEPCGKALRSARRARALAPLAQWAGLVGFAAASSAHFTEQFPLAGAQPGLVATVLGLAPALSLSLSALGVALAYGAQAAERALTEGASPPPRNRPP